MAKECSNSIKLIEHSQIRPAPSSVPSTPLVCTFFDIPWVGPLCAQRVYFYEYPYPTQSFIKTFLPDLKRSLSLTLCHFYPLSGNLYCPPPPQKPFIQYTDKYAVNLSIVETAADFAHLVGKHPRDIKQLEALVPELPSITCKDDDTIVFPFLALQVTIFPDCGFSIGIKFRHIIDGRCFNHFMKSWSSVCRSGGDLFCIENSLPCYHRDSIRDPYDLEATSLEDYYTTRSAWKNSLVGTNSDGFTKFPAGALKSKFFLSQADTDKLKNWVSTRCRIKNETSPENVSRFVVASAFIWICFLKTKYNDVAKGIATLKDDNAEEYLLFPADCRNRLDPPLPMGYFGSCLVTFDAAVKRRDLLGENGVVDAVKAIASGISKMKSDPLENMSRWRTKLKELYVLGHSLVYITGSPTFGVYGMDFGLGRPKLVEMINPEKSIALDESRDEEGGIEVGLVFKREEMELFVSIFEQGLNSI